MPTRAVAKSCEVTQQGFGQLGGLLIQHSKGCIVGFSPLKSS